jgi:hypothetical protein
MRIHKYFDFGRFWLHLEYPGSVPRLFNNL